MAGCGNGGGGVRGTEPVRGAPGEMGVGEGCVVRMSVPVNDVPDVAGTDNLADIAVEWEEGDVERCAYGCEEVGMAARAEGRKVTIKMDSGCSRCMSGVPGRIKAHSEDCLCTE